MKGDRIVRGGSLRTHCEDLIPFLPRTLGDWVLLIAVLGGFFAIMTFFGGRV